jgi:hypothetical protein
MLTTTLELNLFYSNILFYSKNKYLQTVPTITVIDDSVRMGIKDTILNNSTNYFSGSRRKSLIWRIFQPENLHSVFGDVTD